MLQIVVQVFADLFKHDSTTRAASARGPAKQLAQGEREDVLYFTQRAPAGICFCETTYRSVVSVQPPHVSNLQCITRLQVGRERARHTLGIKHLLDGAGDAGRITENHKFEAIVRD